MIENKNNAFINQYQSSKELISYQNLKIRAVIKDEDPKLCMDRYKIKYFFTQPFLKVQ